MADDPNPSLPPNTCGVQAEVGVVSHAAGAMHDEVIDRCTDLVVGAHLLGPAYSELVNTFGLATRVGLTTRS